MAARSFYLPMRDGVRIAIDLHLPAKALAGRRVPAILHQTRYYRSIACRRLAAQLGVARLLDDRAEIRGRFLASGYAWLDVCVRGSGASGGHRPNPWSQDEVEDGRQIVDWIVAQPWSDRRVGATGVSYSGTTAELLLSNAHPAVRAAAPRFSLFDVYTDVAFPGGVHLAWFTEAWGALNRALDANDLPLAFARLMHSGLLGKASFQREGGSRLGAALSGALATAYGERLLALGIAAVAAGVRPVEEDLDGRLLEAAIRDHSRNFDVHQGALRLTYRDDAGGSEERPEDTIDAFSPHRHAGRVSDSGAAVLGYSGWYDGAYQLAAIKRFGALSGGPQQLIIGPWDHGGGSHISPEGPVGRSAFDHSGELLRFFDDALRGDAFDGSSRPPVRYYAMGLERWLESRTWPPENARPERFFFSLERGLTRREPREGVAEYLGRADVGTGMRSRWRSLLRPLVPVGYGDRRSMDERMLCFTSEALERSLLVTGHPVVDLSMACSREDVQLFCYLEELDERGRSTYVTEGVLRAIHRESAEVRPVAPGLPGRSFLRRHAAPLVPGVRERIRIELLPISYLFRKHRRVRVAIALADRDHFGALAGAMPSIAVFLGGCSSLELPVEG